MTTPLPFCFCVCFSSYSQLAPQTQAYTPHKAILQAFKSPTLLALFFSVASSFIASAFILLFQIALMRQESRIRLVYF